MAETFILSGDQHDPLAMTDVWKHLLVQGPKEQIDRFLHEVGQGFERLGWSREPNREAQLNRDEQALNRFFCWASGPNTQPRVLLCLNRATDRRVRGGTWNLFQDQANLADLARAIRCVLREVLEPAAAAVGLALAYPHLGPISRVGPGTLTALIALAEAGAGQWPLSEEMEPLWRHFVVTAYREDAALHPEELTAWFTASGWDGRASAQLAKRFYADAALLGEFEDGRRPA